MNHAPRHVLLLFTFAALLCLSAPLLGQVPIDYQYTYDDIGQLVRAIDSDGNVVTYTYDASGSIIAITRSTTVDLGPPQITSVSPNIVHQGETVEIAIAGTNLLLGSLSTDNPGISVTASRAGDTEIPATLIIAPAAAIGATTLTVTTSLGFDSTVITVLGPLSTIVGISPSRGVAAGGTAVTLSGTNFTPDSSITIGGSLATDVVFIDSKTMTATTPAGTPNSQVDVVLSNSNGSSTLTGGFIYTFGFSTPGAVVIAIGGTGTFMVTLDQPATADTTVFLSSSNALVATVPASVIVPAGARTGVIPVTPVSAGTTTVTVTINGESLTTTVFVTAPFTEALNPIMAPVMGNYVIPNTDGPTLAPVAGAFVTPITDGPVLAPVAGAFITPITDGPVLAPVVGVCVASAPCEL